MSRDCITPAKPGDDAMTLPPIADQVRTNWTNGRDSSLPLPGPIPCLDEADNIANDNAQRCRRSGVAIDPMFLN